MGSTQSHEGGDEADLPRDLDSDVREMYAIGEPASGSSQLQSGGSKRSRRQTRHASAKSSTKSKGSYAAVRKTRRR